LVTPALGTPASGNLANCTFPTLNQNTTGTAAGLSTTLAVSSGGTGQTSYTDGQLLIGNTTGNTLTKTTLTAGTGISITNGSGTISIAATGAGGTVTSVAQSFTGGIISVGGSPITSSGTLALTVAGTSGGIPYFTSGTAWATSAVLTQYGIVYGGGAGATPVATAAGTTGQVLTANTGAAPTWGTAATGTVTSVGWTGGIVSIATATTTPAFTIAGTSGGIPYFSSGTTWATSAALAANAIVIGGGAGTAPATTATGTGVVTAIGNAVNNTSGLVTQTATLAASAILIGGGASTGIASTTTGTGVVTALGVNTGTAGAFVVNGGALGTPSSGTLSSTTVDGTNGVGYINIPQNAQTGSYTLVAGDAGKHIYHAAAAAAATYTIPANASVAYAIGTAVTFINMSTNNVTVSITTDTLYLGGTGTTGSRTLAQYGVATAVKMTSTTWVITGSGLT